MEIWIVLRGPNVKRLHESFLLMKLMDDLTWLLTDLCLSCPFCFWPIYQCLCFRKSFINSKRWVRKRFIAGRNFHFQEIFNGWIDIAVTPGTSCFSLSYIFCLHNLQHIVQESHRLQLTLYFFELFPNMHDFLQPL